MLKTVFWEAVEGDTRLQEKLSASTDGEIDTPIEAAAVVAIANEAGFTITAGDLLKADAQAILELNDEDLEKVAGGLTLCGYQIRGTAGQNVMSCLLEGKKYDMDQSGRIFTETGWGNRKVVGGAK